jgi:PqqD family protein of HPr-rel-A system
VIVASPQRSETRATTSIYRLTSSGRDLVQERWEGLHVVYQRTSGETHVFNETAVATLKSLQDGLVSLDEMVRLVAHTMGVKQEDLASEDFLAVAARLDELGLVERLDRPPSAS